MDKSSKIYLAGHNGLVGSAILRRLQAGGYTNIITKTSRELDLTRQTEVELFFEKEQPEYVFLAAAKVGGILANSTYKAEFIYQNLMIASNVIHAAYLYKTKKLLNLGSSCIYPKFAPQPMKEEYLLTGELEATNEPYAVAKIASIKLCRYYNEQYGTNFISAMPTNLYGPKDNFDLNNSHVLPALLRKFHEAKVREANLNEVRGERCEGQEEKLEERGMRNEETASNLQPPASSLTPPTSNLQPRPSTSKVSSASTLQPNTSDASSVILWGTGSPFREFLYVDDLADACVFLMEKYDYAEIGELINIGTGEDISIRDLAAMISDIVGFTGEVVWDSTKPDGTPKKLLDISRIRQLGWEPKTTLEEGIRRAYDWYLSTV
jgi:GDP-L-fucose synthase